MSVTHRQADGHPDFDVGLAFSARTQYAIRAMLALAQSQHDNTGPLSVDTIASRHDMPGKFLEKVIADLRTAGLVVSTRGARGGYTLAHPASEVSLGDVVRAATRPASRPNGQQKLAIPDEGIAQHLPAVWHALRAAQRDILDRTSLKDALTGQLTPAE